MACRRARQPASSRPQDSELDRGVNFPYLAAAPDEQPFDIHGHCNPHAHNGLHGGQIQPRHDMGRHPHVNSRWQNCRGVFPAVRFCCSSFRLPAWPQVFSHLVPSVARWAECARGTHGVPTRRGSNEQPRIGAPFSGTKPSVHTRNPQTLLKDESSGNCLSLTHEARTACR